MCIIGYNRHFAYQRSKHRQMINRITVGETNVASIKSQGVTCVKPPLQYNSIIYSSFPCLKRYGIIIRVSFCFRRHTCACHLAQTSLWFDCTPFNVTPCSFAPMLDGKSKLLTLFCNEMKTYIRIFMEIIQHMSLKFQEKLCTLKKGERQADSDVSQWTKNSLLV